MVSNNHLCRCSPGCRCRQDCSSIGSRPQSYSRRCRSCWQRIPFCSRHWDNRLRRAATGSCTQSRRRRAKPHPSWACRCNLGHCRSRSRSRTPGLRCRPVPPWHLRLFLHCPVHLARWLHPGRYRPAHPGPRPNRCSWRFRLGRLRPIRYSCRLGHLAMWFHPGRCSCHPVHPGRHLDRWTWSFHLVHPGRRLGRWKFR